MTLLVVILVAHFAKLSGTGKLDTDSVYQKKKTLIVGILNFRESGLLTLSSTMGVSAQDSKRCGPRACLPPREEARAWKFEAQQHPLGQ